MFEEFLFVILQKVKKPKTQNTFRLFEISFYNKSKSRKVKTNFEKSKDLLKLYFDFLEISFYEKSKSQEVKKHFEKVEKVYFLTV